MKVGRTYLGSEDVIVDFIYDWLYVVLHHQRCFVIHNTLTYQNISTELVGFVLDGGILLSDDSSNITSSFSNTLPYQL